MAPKEKKTLNNNQQYVMHLRYRLIKYQLDGIDPPERLLNELIIAKRLVRLNSRARE
jgi:uncharacterized protein YcfL